MVTLSQWNWQSRGVVGRGLWEVSEKKPVRRYAQEFLGISITYEIYRRKRNGVLSLGQLGKALSKSRLGKRSHGTLWLKGRDTVIKGLPGNLGGARGKSCKAMRILVVGLGIWA